MVQEKIDRVEVLDNGELLLGLEGQGQTMYQYVYREAAGVYWDKALRGFKSTPKKEWSYSQWYKHIVSVVSLGLGVELSFADQIAWSGVPEDERAEIEREGII